MESRISRHTVKAWLEDWDCVVNGGPPSKDRIAGNSGSKPVDGVTNGRLNAIMLKDAVEHLPPSLRQVVYYRWISPLASLNQTLRRLGYTKDQYYYRCDKAVTSIFHYLNGETFVAQTTNN